MQKSGPEKLNYIAPEEDEGEVPGVSRYYREPPALSRLVGIVVAILIGVAAIIAIGFLYLRRGF